MTTQNICSSARLRMGLGPRGPHAQTSLRDLPSSSQYRPRGTRVAGDFPTRPHRRPAEVYPIRFHSCLLGFLICCPNRGAQLGPPTRTPSKPSKRTLKSLVSSDTLSASSLEPHRQNKRACNQSASTPRRSSFQQKHELDTSFCHVQTVSARS